MSAFPKNLSCFDGKTKCIHALGEQQGSRMQGKLKENHAQSSDHVWTGHYWCALQMGSGLCRTIREPVQRCHSLILETCKLLCASSKDWTEEGLPQSLKCSDPSGAHIWTAIVFRQWQSLSHSTQAICHLLLSVWPGKISLPLAKRLSCYWDPPGLELVGPNIWRAFSTCLWDVVYLVPC